MNCKIGKEFDRESINYDQKHHEYPLLDLLEKRRKEIILENLKFIKMPIVDLACGTGNYLLLLKEMGMNNIYANDISKNMLKICKEKGIKNVSNYSFENTGFNSDSFSTILLINSIQYSKKQGEVLNECNKILKKGHILIISFYILNFRTIIPYLIKKYLKKKMDIHSQRVLLTTRKINYLIEKSDFRIINCYGLSFFPLKSNSKIPKKTISFFNLIEQLFYKSNLKYLFAGEIVYILRN